MSKRLKLITALLSMILTMSLFGITAYAVDADGDGYDDETGEYVGVITEPVYTEPVYTEPVYTEPEYTEPVYTEPVWTEPVYTEPVWTEPVYTDPIDYNDDYNDDYDDQSSDSYNDYDFDTEYDVDYSDDSYVAPATSPMYESDREIDDSELSKSDWDYIKANLSNADGSDDGADDFNFIKKNDSKGDNGDWMLIVGVACILLSIAGITYVIASGVLRRKKINSGAYATASSNPRYRDDDDYGDGYKVLRSEKKKAERSSKYDTADVVLPRNKNGRRYK